MYLVQMCSIYLLLINSMEAEYIPVLLEVRGAISHEIILTNGYVGVQ